MAILLFSQNRRYNCMKGIKALSIFVYRCLLVFSFLLFTTSFPLYAFSQKTDYAQIDRHGAHNLLPQNVSGLPIDVFLHSNSFQLVLKKEIIKHEHQFGICDTPEYNGRTQVSRPVIPWEIPEFGVVPQWIETIELTGCKQKYSRKALIAIIHGAPRIYPILPGNALSLIDFNLRKDLMKTLLSSEREHAIAQGCTKKSKIRIHNTSLLSFKQQAEETSWEESWHISNCQNQKILKVTFTTHPATGTYFEIHQPEPKKVIAKSNTSSKDSTKSPN